MRSLVDPQTDLKRILTWFIYCTTGHRVSGVVAWRLARAVDLPDIERIAALVHPAHPEGPAVFAERLALHPPGCLLLEQEDGASGYVISHPWRRLHPPKLDQHLGGLPDWPDSYLIHDLALLPSCRGSGHARRVAMLLQQQAVAARLPELSLVSLAGSVGFWTTMGFQPARLPASQAPGLLAYGPGAVFMVKWLATAGTER